MFLDQSDVICIHFTNPSAHTTVVQSSLLNSRKRDLHAKPPCHRNGGARQTLHRMATWETLKAKPSIESVFTSLASNWLLHRVPLFCTKARSTATTQQISRLDEFFKLWSQLIWFLKATDIQQFFRDQFMSGIVTMLPGMTFRFSLSGLMSLSIVHSLRRSEDFAVNGDDSVLLSSPVSGGWKCLVQPNGGRWLDSWGFNNQPVIRFPCEKEVSPHLHDDCRGMFNFFVLKHRRARNGCISPLVPKLACPPFGTQLEGFGQYWSVDNCQVIFNSIRQIDWTRNAAFTLSHRPVARWLLKSQRQITHAFLQLALYPQEPIWGER